MEDMTLRELRSWRPAAASRYPADPRAVFVLGLAVASGLPLMLFRVQPGSIERLMPTWVVFLWGLFLVIGSALSLVGMSMARKDKESDGAIVEQIGSVAVGAATVFYAASQLFAVGAEAAWGASIILAFGISCFWRWYQLQKLIMGKIVLVEALRALEDMEHDQ